MQCRSFARGFGLAAVLVFSACSDLQVEEREPVEAVEGFAGLVVADEPRAATIGRDILLDGGNAKVVLCERGVVSFDSAVPAGNSVRTAMPRTY